MLAEAASVEDPGERARVIERTRNAIVLAAEKAQPGRRAEVAEMFAGRTYVLFVYAIFRDVRLVYAPPRAIGEFAGEDDNWRWPRHTGDFSFMRVYVAPDGGPAAYDARNVPYHPKTVLKVNPRGVNEGDAVFLLGYPGRTFRHRSSHFLSFEQDVRLPYISDLYEMQIATLERAGRNDRAVSLKFDARIKSQSNVMKNYRGKLAGRILLLGEARDCLRRLRAAPEALQRSGGRAAHDILTTCSSRALDGSSRRPSPFLPPCLTWAATSASGHASLASWLHGA